MFNYLTNTNNLHNILWVYSPDQSRGNRTTYYPGSAYVDIAALDVYVDDPVRYIVDRNFKITCTFLDYYEWL